MNALQNKRALVCGGSAGIGLASAQKLAAMGASVHLISRTEEKLKKAIETLPNQNLNHTYSVIDLQNTQLIQEKIPEVLKDGPIQILVCNSEGPKPGPLSEASLESLTNGFQQHIIANTTLLQMCLPGMKESQYGRIIGIISTSVREPIMGLGVSNTIRGAHASWAKTLSKELGQFQVTVNNVLPGFTETDRLESIIQGKTKKLGKSKDEVIASLKATVPVGRFGKAEEVAAAVAFLASPEASYINGVCLPVDGGRIASI